PYVPPPLLTARITRVAADGTLLDPKPLTIVDHRENLSIHGIHVASSGYGALVVLDLANRVDAVAVRDDAPLTRRTLLQWGDPNGHDVASNATFDGVTYVVAWRFRDAFNSWLGTGRISADGLGGLTDRHVISPGERGGDELFAPGVA